MEEKQFESCMKRMAEKDRSALKEVYESYISYIYHIVYNVVGNKENAEDITSEFFIKLWNKAGEYKGGNGHRGYLATIARNMAIDFMRKYKREDITEELPEGKDDVAESVETEVIEQISVEEALSRLKETEREIVHLKVIGEMTFQEIANILNQPLGTVTWRYQEAIKKLRRCGYE